MAENGRVYKIDGFTEKKMGSSDFAKETIKRWVVPLLGGQRRRMVYACCDPANDAAYRQRAKQHGHHGEEFAKHDIPMVNAHKAGWTTSSGCIAG